MSGLVHRSLLQLLACGDPASKGARPVDTADREAIDTAAPGCASSLWTSGSYTVDHGGVRRAFRVYVPSSYDATIPPPLVLAFHGWGGDAGEFLDDPTVTAEADARGYVVIAPDGLGPEEAGHPAASWSFRGSTTGLDGDGLNPEVAGNGLGRGGTGDARTQAASREEKEDDDAGDTTDICDDARTNDYDYPSCAGLAENGCSWTQCQDDDVDLAMSLVAAASQNLCVDAGRVYAVDGSHGGMFTWELGQNEVSARTFRATAPLIGLPHRGYLSPPARPARPRSRGCGPKPWGVTALWPPPRSTWACPTSTVGPTVPGARPGLRCWTAEPRWATPTTSGGRGRWCWTSSTATRRTARGRAACGSPSS